MFTLQLWYLDILKGGKQSLLTAFVIARKATNSLIFRTSHTTDRLLEIVSCSRPTILHTALVYASSCKAEKTVMTS